MSVHARAEVPRHAIDEDGHPLRAGTRGTRAVAGAGRPGELMEAVMEEATDEVMDEIEHIERGKLYVFAVCAVITFLVTVLWRRDLPLAASAAGVAALLFSGAWGARRMTADHHWAVLQAEGRLNGDLPSKRRVWAGNLLPGALAALALLWWRAG